MSWMFGSCESLTNIDVSNFNTANVDNMRAMFYNCAELGNVDVRGFKTDNVTDMSWMFAYCKKMTEIDLNSFKTSNVTDMSYMFYVSDAVKTIYVSDRWDMTNVTASDKMFGGCEMLVGGAGTAYEYGKMDGTYAHVDEGTTNPGYFTLKSPDVFTLTYLLDGEVYKEMKVTVGTAITPETVPDKEGYTFSGWGDVPATMPAEDLVLQGTYNINSYMITYRIDGALFKTEMVKYGDPIVPPAAPEKAGYTFEWLDVPATMPAKNIEIIGQYTTGIGTIHADMQHAEWYTIEGRRISAPRKGLNIMRKADGTVKKVMVK
jgi:surface protein